MLHIFTYPYFTKLLLSPLCTTLPLPLFVIKTYYKTQLLCFTCTDISKSTCKENKERESKEGPLIRSSEKTETL